MLPRLQIKYIKCRHGLTELKIKRKSNAFPKSLFLRTSNCSFALSKLIELSQSTLESEAASRLGVCYQ